jgi:hypothetical protein
MKYKLSNSQVSTTLSGDSVILNHKKGEYFTLNEVGSLVWEQMQSGPKNVEELITAVQTEYEISYDECKSDIESLIKDLTNENLVEIA